MTPPTPKENPPNKLPRPRTTCSSTKPLRESRREKNRQGPHQKEEKKKNKKKILPNHTITPISRKLPFCSSNEEKISINIYTHIYYHHHTITFSLYAFFLITSGSFLLHQIKQQTLKKTKKIKKDIKHQLIGANCGIEKHFLKQLKIDNLLLSI